VASFEDVFSDAQMEMIFVALEYADNNVSDVFVQFGILRGMRHGDCFFAKDGRTYLRHELPGVDKSIDRQRVLLHTIMEEAQRIWLAGQECNREVPVEGYLRYHVGGALDARYSYQDIPVGEDTKWKDKLEAWRQSVQQDLDKT